MTFEPLLPNLKFLNSRRQNLPAVQQPQAPHEKARGHNDHHERRPNRVGKLPNVHHPGIDRQPEQQQQQHEQQPLVNE